jgi:small-conductance mechanosensitive channel
MPSESDLAPLLELLDKSLVFIERPGVQLQLLAIILALSMAWILTRKLWVLIHQQLLPSLRSTLLKSPHPYLKRSLEFVQYLLFPGLGLLALALAQLLLLSLGRFSGLLTIAVELFWFLLGYRVCISVLHLIAGESNTRRYRVRLLAPILSLVIAGEILGLLTPINKLAAVGLAKVFENSITLGEIFIATVGLYLWFYAVNLLQEVLFRSVTRLTQSNPGQVEVTLTLGRYFLMTLGVIVVLSQIGLDSTTLAAITGGLSVGVGFGLREILGNFVSGITLLFEGALRPGDVVEVDGEVTTVKSFSIRATTVKTLNNIEKIVPNQTFFTSTVTTYTGTDPVVRILVPVGVSYECDPEEVIEILLEVAQQHPRVRSEPHPYVFLMGYGESSVDFNLAIFIDSPLMQWVVKSDLYRAIWKALAARKIEIPFPKRDLHIRSVVPWEGFERHDSARNVP